MLINIDYSSRIPIYEQIADGIIKLINAGILKPDEQILSIREFACNLGINPNTVKKAYDLLEKEKIIVRKSTKGTFISLDIKKAQELQINKLIKSIRENIIELENIGLSKDDILKRIEK